MRVAVYLRVSTDKQTVDNQRADCLKLAPNFGQHDQAGWGPDVHEEQESGAKARPILEQLLASLRAGDVLVVWALDRLGRDALHVISTVKALVARGVRVASVKEPWLDTVGPTRDLLLYIFSWVAEQERGRLIERTRAGLATAKAKGRVGGRPTNETYWRAWRLVRKEGYTEVAAALKMGVKLEAMVGWAQNHAIMVDQENPPPRNPGW